MTSVGSAAAVRNFRRVFFPELILFIVIPNF
jgi:hypothetical protein